MLKAQDAIPQTARAAVLVGPNQPLEIVDVPIPRELEPGAILVKTTMASICGTDVHAMFGGHGTVFPRILGHEMTGRIARVGPGVTHDSIGQELGVGDRIIWTFASCGQCRECVLLGQPMLCEERRYYMQDRWTEPPHLTGAFAEYIYVFPTAGRLKVPDEVPDALAAAASCALRTVMHGFERLGPVDDRHTVLVQGSGPLGLFALARAIVAGAARVVVAGGGSQRLEIARRWGAAEVVDIEAVPDPAERAEIIRGLTGGRGCDVVVEVSGQASAFVEGMNILRRGGRYLVIGLVGNETVTFSPGLIVTKQVQIIGTQAASVAHYHRALEFLIQTRDRFEWDAMISNVYPLEEINIAMERMRTYEDIKAAIAFGDAGA
jgi:threonine dehydrogenase-like Zn-dependent dehydrogenase